MLGVAQSPILSQRFDLTKIFEHVAQLGGAKNIKNFEVQVAPPGAAPPPGSVPVGAPPGLPSGSTTPGLSGNASDRIAQ